MALVSGRRSVLNPDAPLFIPAAFRQVEDFSPEWWELVKTSTWFRDYWISEHQEEKFDGDDANADDEYDIENLLPESFDIGIDEEFPNPETQLDELVQSCVFEVENGSAPVALMKDTPRNGVEMDMNKAMMEKLLMVQSSKERGPKCPIEPARYHEKPAQCVSPKCRSPRRIQQPR